MRVTDKPSPSPLSQFDASAHHTGIHTLWTFRLSLPSCLPACLSIYLSIYLPACLSQQPLLGAIAESIYRHQAPARLCQLELPRLSRLRASDQGHSQQQVSLRMRPSYPTATLAWAPQSRREILRTARRQAAGGVRAERGKALVGSVVVTDHQDIATRMITGEALGTFR